jgi:hypothetical protein
MIAIWKEIESTTLDNPNNVLKKCAAYFNDGYANDWNFPYTREKSSH